MQLHKGERTGNVFVKMEGQRRPIVVPYRARVFHGKLQIDDAEVSFISPDEDEGGDGPFDAISNVVTVKNKFPTPIKFLSAKVTRIEGVDDDRIADDKIASFDVSGVDLGEIVLSEGTLSPFTLEWTPTRASGSNCWIGRYAKPEPGSDPGRGYISRARGNIPPPPPPPPPPFPPGQPHILDDSKGLGLRWEGIGAISGGGATSKLLMDYEPSVVADILDFLFKPSEICLLVRCVTWLLSAPSNHHTVRAPFVSEPP